MLYILPSLVVFKTSFKIIPKVDRHLVKASEDKSVVSRVTFLTTIHLCVCISLFPLYRVSILLKIKIRNSGLFLHFATKRILQITYDAPDLCHFECLSTML